MFGTREMWGPTSSLKPFSLGRGRRGAECFGGRQKTAHDSSRQGAESARRFRDSPRTPSGCACGDAALYQEGLLPRTQDLDESSQGAQGLSGTQNWDREVSMKRLVTGPQRGETGS